MQTNNRKNLYILAFTLTVIMLGYGMVIPIMPFYIEKLGASGSQLGLLVASYGLMRLVFAPLWGNVSDRMGRKPVLMIGVLGNGLALLLFGLSDRLWMLFAARMLSGVLSSATSPTTMAYISDSTSEQDRGKGMGILGAAVGVGTVFGPGLGGWLAGDSLATPFFIAAGLSLLSLGLIYWLLPESLPAQERETGQPGKRQSRRQVMWQALYSPIGVLLVMAVLATAGTTTFYGIFGLYALAKYNYGPEQVGMILMVVGIISALAQGVLTGPLTNRWGEATVIKLSLLGSAAGFVLMLLAGDLLTVLATTGLFILVNALLNPAVSALTSRHTHLPQGVAMGLSNAFGSLGRIIGPLWAGIAFDLSVDAPYLGGSAIMLLGFTISLLWVSQTVRERRSLHAER